MFFPGVKTSRDAFLVDHDLDVLKARLAVYFDPTISHGEIGRRYPAVMKTTRRFPARAVRDALLARGGPTAGGFVRYAYRPFDNRWLYWEAETKLLDEKRPDYRPQVFAGNTWLCVVPRLRRDAAEAQVTATPNLASLHLNEWGASLVPRLLRGAGLTAREGPAPNLSASARRYLERTNAEPADLFHHALRVFHDPEYREANAGALSVEWPRIPLPGWPDGRASGAAEALRTSAATGRRLAALLDPDTPVPGVTEGPLPPELAAIAVPATGSGRQMAGSDFAVRAGWGHFGAARAVMPGAGRARERAFTAPERDALAGAGAVLGETTYDIHLNDRAFFRNVPAAVWRYRLGGYQVLKKWLSYREERVLGRPLRPDEVHHFTNTARRIAAILLLVSPSRA